MGENEASLPNTALQGKCQQPLKWLQSDMSVVSITEVCVCVCVCVCVRVHPCCVLRCALRVGKEVGIVSEEAAVSSVFLNYSTYTETQIWWSRENLILLELYCWRNGTTYFQSIFMQNSSQY